MAWLPHGEKILKICLFILTELTNVTDRQTDGQTPHAGIYRAYASHRALKRRHVDFQDGGSQPSWILGVRNGFFEKPMYDFL